MAKQITLTIDNIKTEVPENTLIVNAAKKVGIAIPVFCYHPKLQPVGMCRVCLVEVGRPMIDRATGTPVLEPNGETKLQFGPKLETACTTPVSEGMVVKTDSDKVKAARKEILEFILTSHPLDCPVCDKGGECPLQSLTMRYGPDSSRFLYDEKKHLEKNVPLGDLIYLDRERCIQCGRCIRFQTEIVKEPVIGFYQRGRSTQVITSSDPGFNSVFSGNTTDICPVGALTTVDFRFGARPWELVSHDSLCTHCPVGCNISIDVRREVKSGGQHVVKRIMPRQNESVNSIWICDKGRFAHHFTNRDVRFAKPLVRKNGKLVPIGLEPALDLIAARLRGKKSKLITLLGGRLSNEDLFNFKSLTDKLDGKVYFYTDQDGGEVTRFAGIGPGTDLTAISSGTVILTVACDVYEEAPLYWLWIQQAVKRGAKLITINPRRNRLDQLASEVIHYRYGQESKTLDKLLDDQSNGNLQITKLIQKAEGLIIFVGQDGLSASASKNVCQSAAQLLADNGFMTKDGSGVVVIGQAANSQGAWEMGLMPTRSLGKAIHGADVLLVAGVDLLGDHPELEEDIQSVKMTVVLELAATPTSEQADVVIPVLAFTERAGTYTSAARRVQMWQQALPGPAEMRADYAIAAMLGNRLGVSLSGDAQGVFSELAQAIPVYRDITYERLSNKIEQWPATGGMNKYFSGTAASNSSGIGIQLPLLRRNSTSRIKMVGVKESNYNPDKLWAVPITRLYDLGNTLRPSKILEQKMTAFEIFIHPATAADLNICQEAVTLTIDGKKKLVRCVVNEDAPQGFVLIPRSSGIPLSEIKEIHISAIADQNQNKGKGHI